MLLATSVAFMLTGHSRGPAVTPRSITASSVVTGLARGPTVTPRNVVMRESPEPSMANAACAVLTVQDADASKLSPLLQSAWMEGCIKRGLDGHIEPVASDAVEILHVAGLRAAELMRVVCPEAEDVPFLQMRELEVLGVPAKVRGPNSTQLHSTQLNSTPLNYSCTAVYPYRLFSP